VKRAKKKRGTPKFDWAGALNDLRNQYTYGKGLL